MVDDDPENWRWYSMIEGTRVKISVYRLIVTLNGTISNN